MKIIELSEAKLDEYLNDFFKCFSTGYDFEEFLKIYLGKLGFDEIQITKRSRDGGVDLIAVRSGIGNFSDADAVNYYIQAKRYKDSKKIKVNAIRELKGVIPFGHKGMLITTSAFTKDAEKESVNDISKPVILVDGKMLLRSCIEKGIGFMYEPKFSKEELNCFIESSNGYIDENEQISREEMLEIGSIEKRITNNDIRARIISVPGKIAKMLEGRKNYVIEFENDEFVSKFVDSRKYFSAGFSDVYRKYGLLSNNDRIITSKIALWTIKNDKIIIKLK